MSIEVKDASDISACPYGFYCLFENENYKIDGGKVLISDESIPNLRGYNFSRKASAVANRAGPLQLIGHDGYKVDVPNWFSFNLASVPNQGIWGGTMDDRVVATFLF